MSKELCRFCGGKGYILKWHLGLEACSCSIKEPEKIEVSKEAVESLLKAVAPFVARWELANEIISVDENSVKDMPGGLVTLYGIKTQVACLGLSANHWEELSKHTLALWTIVDGVKSDET